MPLTPNALFTFLGPDSVRLHTRGDCGSEHKLCPDQDTCCDLGDTCCPFPGSNTGTGCCDAGPNVSNVLSEISINNI